MAEARLILRRTFWADHFHDLPGFVEDRHGHEWGLEVSVDGAEADAEARFHGAVEAWVADMEDGLLNAVPRLEGRNPTAEALAQSLLEHLEGAGFAGGFVRMREKANYLASCRRGTA